MSWDYKPKRWLARFEETTEEMKRRVELELKQLRSENQSDLPENDKTDSNSKADESLDEQQPEGDKEDSNS